jgi:hypothetical protein
VNALANPEVGKYVNENFVAAFQKVGTFVVNNGNKQGGNVASYFCAPDGRVLHVVAGPVDAGTFLREAKWVVTAAEKAIDESKKSGKQFKVLMREMHAAKLREESGLTVEPVTFDYVAQDDNSALTYRDPTGRPLAPVLPPPPIEGPDVRLELKEFNARQANLAGAPGAAICLDKAGRKCGVLGNQGRSDILMAAHSMQPIEKVYGSVFEGILGERVSTKPVEVITPFSWRPEGKRGALLNLNGGGLNPSGR